METSFIRFKRKRWKKKIFDFFRARNVGKWFIMNFHIFYFETGENSTIIINNERSNVRQKLLWFNYCCDSIIIWMCVIASPLLCTALILLSRFDLNRFYGIKLLLLTVPFNRTNTKDVYVCFSTLEWDNFVLRDSKNSKICIDIWSQNLLKNILGLLQLICYVFLTTPFCWIAAMVALVRNFLFCENHRTVSSFNEKK